MSLNFEENGTQNLDSLFIRTELEKNNSVQLPCGVAIIKSPKGFSEDGRPLRFTVSLDRHIDGVFEAAITSRDLEASLKEVPDLLSRLESQKNLKRVIVLGNGFSSLPIEIKNKLSKSAQLVVVDLFGYEDLEADLQPYKGISQVKKILHTIQEMKTLESEGVLSFVKYKVGDRNDNPQLKGADIVINVCGPTKNTLQSQLEMLDQNGLLVSWFGTFRKNGEELPEL